MSPALYLSIPNHLLKGDKEKIGPFPPERTLEAAAAMTGWKPLELVRDKVAVWKNNAGLTEFGEWSDYYIDRQLANMVADGAIDYKTAIQTMIGRQGPAYDQALERVRMEMMVRTPGALTYYGMRQGDFPSAIASIMFGWMPAGLLPEGELEMRGLQEEYNAARQRYNQGERGAMNEFFDAHPEYEARLALFAEPEERMHQFLVSEVWDRWHGMGGKDKQAVIEAFGEDFQVFLSGNDEMINDETLAGWSQSLGGETAGMEVEDIDIDYLPLGVRTQYQEFVAEREELFPGASTAINYAYTLPEEQRKAIMRQIPRGYWELRERYAAMYPELEPYIITQREEGAPREIPDLHELETEAVKAQISAYPALEIELSTYVEGKQLTPGAIDALRYIWEKHWSYSYGSFYDWLSVIL